MKKLLLALAPTILSRILRARREKQARSTQTHGRDRR
jgi:hypothetical protein